jgi:outer membrane protein assembly factor BamD (BamD/ComL family)
LASVATASTLQVKVAPAKNSGLTFRPSDPLNDEAFDAFYNLEYDKAVGDFEKIVERHPDDPFAINHLVNALLFHEWVL